MKRRYLVGLVLFLALSTVVWLYWGRRPLLRAQKFIESPPRFFLNPDMLYKFDYSNIEQHPKWPLVVEVMASGNMINHGELLELCPDRARWGRDHCVEEGMPTDPFRHKSDCPYGILVSYLFFQGLVPWHCID